MSDLATEDIVYQRAARLLAVRDAVADAFGGQKRKVTAPTDLKFAVKQFREALFAISGSYGVIVGGLAVQEHGYVRWTEDVDVVVDAQHHAAILDHLQNRGFSLGADLHLRKSDSGTLLDILKEGDVRRNALLPTPAPSELGPNGGFATLEAVIRLKIDSGGRLQPQADIVELLKRFPDQIPSVESVLPDVLKPDYMRLAQQARREMQA